MKFAVPSFFKSKRFTSAVLALILFAGTSFFFRIPHSDLYTGLDVSMYARMAHLFARGESAKSRDTAFASVPENVRPLLLYREGGRLTRDGVFEINTATCETKPFFVPTLPYAAAAASRIGVPPVYFVPLLGVLWLAVLFVCAAIGRANGGGTTPLIVAALYMTTAWPVWFLRGFYPEAAGGALLGISIALREKRSASVAFFAGLLLGLAVSFHYSLCVLALPIAFCALLRGGGKLRALALILGGAVGTLPLVLITKFVCQPYGDFLDPQTLAVMMRHPVIRVVVYAVAAALTLGGAVLTLTFFKQEKKENWENWENEKIKANNIQDKNFLYFLISLLKKHSFLIYVFILLLIILVPFIVGGDLRRGAEQTFAGIGWRGALIFGSVTALFLCDKDRHFSDKLLLLLIGAAALVFVYIKGVEVPVGIWSQRRFAPIVICLISLLAMTRISIDEIIDKSISYFSFFFGKNKLSFFVFFFLALTASCVFIFAPLEQFILYMPAFLTSNGSAKITSDKQHPNWNPDGVDTNALCVYDYFPHSFPHQRRDLQTFGINEYAAKRLGHEPVMEWLANEAATGRTVRIVSSYDLPERIIENEISLFKYGRQKIEITEARTKHFFPIQKHKREILQNLYDVKPLNGTNGCDAVTVTPSASPLGLRAPWGRTARDGGRWTRQGSGVVGLQPESGGKVSIEINAGWFPTDSESDWTSQTLVITPPFPHAAPLEFEISGTNCVVSGEIESLAQDDFSPTATGVYRFSVKRPYDPAAYGIKGYDADLGVVIECVNFTLKTAKDVE